MAIDMMQTLVELLCPQNPTLPNASSMCSQFISQQAGFGLMGQLFYFLLFPTIFLLVFVYIISSSVLKGDAARVRMFNWLIAAGVFIFIVINGYYAIVINVAKFWFFALPLLGIIYFVLRHFRGGSGGGGMPLSSGGVTKKLASVAWRKATGMEKADAEFIENQIAILENTERGAHGIDEISGRIDHMLRDFYEKASVIPGVPWAKDYNHLVDRYKNACKKKNIQIPKDIRKISKRQYRAAA